MSNCITHTGLFDDRDNPLDDQGKPYLPGIRLCMHSDCVNPTHLLSYQKRNARHYNLKNPAEYYEEVIRIGNLEPGTAELCSMPDCSRPRKARNLCAPHWSMFRHRQPDKIARTKQMKLSDFPALEPPVSNSDKMALGPRNCNVLDCPNRSRNRGLCPTHWQGFKRTYKREKGIQWKSTQFA